MGSLRQWSVEWVSSTGEVHSAVVLGDDDPVSVLRRGRELADVDHFIVERVRWRELERRHGLPRDQIWKWDQQARSRGIDLPWAVDDEDCLLASEGDLSELVEQLPATLNRHEEFHRIRRTWNDRSIPRPIPSRAVDIEAIDRLS